MIVLPSPVEPLPSTTAKILKFPIGLWFNHCKTSVLRLLLLLFLIKQLKTIMKDGILFNSYQSTYFQEERRRQSIEVIFGVL